MASVTDFFVIALKTTRSIVFPLRRFFFPDKTSSRCHEIASPSLSGSVANISLSAFLREVSISFTRFFDWVSIDQDILNSLSGSTEPFLLGRSRMCPKLARTS